MRLNLPAPAPVEPVARRILRWTSEGILLALVVLTPLAFGSVEPWAVGLIECGASLAFLLWFLERLWFSHPSASSFRVLSTTFAPLRRIGALHVTFLFLLLVALQLLFLPPVLVRILSPGAHAVYQRTLPGYGAGGKVDFNRLEDWLLSEAGAEDTRGHRFPWSADQDPDLVFSSWRPLSLAFSSTLRAAGVLLTLLLVFMMVSDRVREPAFRRRLLWTVALTGVLVSLLGLAQHGSWGDRLYGRIRPAYGGRPMGPFVNANHFAGYLEMALSVLAGLWVAVSRRERDAPPARRSAGSARGADQRYIPQLFIMTLLLGMSALAIWRSGSRGGLLSIALAVLTLVVAWSGGRGERARWRLPLVATILIVLAASVAWKVIALSREEALQTDLSTEPSFLMRLRMWKASLWMLADFPVLGTGLGTYAYSIPLYQGGAYEKLWVHAHNDYVQLGCEAGLAGLVLFAFGFGCFWRRALFPVVARPARWSGAALGPAMGILSLLIHSALDFNLQIPSNGLLFVMLAACLNGVVVGEPTAAPGSPEGVGSPTKSRRPVTTTCVATGAWLVLLGGVIAVVAARTWQSSATAAYWRGDLKTAQASLERSRLVRAWLPDLQADRGFFYLRSLDEEDRTAAELDLPRTEAVARARSSLCLSLNGIPINANSWSGLAELYLQLSAQQLRTEVLDLSELLTARQEGTVPERLHLAVLRKMLQLEPQNPYYSGRLGDFLWVRDERESALQAYRQAVRLLPKVDEHPFLLASGDVRPEVLQAAIAGAEQALHESASGVAPHLVHFNLSILYERARNLSKAIEHTERAWSLAPMRGWYRLRLGYLHFNAGDLESSRRLILESVEGGVRTETPYLYLARIARQQGDTEGAITYYRKALALNPESGRTTFEMARLYDELGDKRMASHYYDLSTEFRPEDVNVLLAAADYYTRQGPVERAIPILRKVVSLRPKEEVYQRRLEQLREQARFLE